MADCGVAGEAFDDFRANDDGFRLREDWQDLIVDRVVIRDDSAFGQFRTKTGIVWLTVTMTNAATGWVVTGWHGCAPPGVGP